jgi:uncharacterized membrane protein (UPF0127 family)
MRAAWSASSFSFTSRGASSRRGLGILLALVSLAGCGSGEKSTGQTRVLLESPTTTAAVSVEMADTDSERARGLMGRASLPAHAGMLFVWGEDHRAPFWMKDTLIPLSIAFYGADGRILRILDMAPCKRDPCPLYDPGVAYRGALEVNAGAFRRWGISESDRLRVTSAQ